MATSTQMIAPRGSHAAREPERATPGRDRIIAATQIGAAASLTATFVAWMARFGALGGPRALERALPWGAGAAALAGLASYALLAERTSLPVVKLDGITRLPEPATGGAGWPVREGSDVGSFLLRRAGEYDPKGTITAGGPIGRSDGYGSLAEALRDWDSGEAIVVRSSDGRLRMQNAVTHRSGSLIREKHARGADINVSDERVEAYISAYGEAFARRQELGNVKGSLSHATTLAPHDPRHPRAGYRIGESHLGSADIREHAPRTLRVPRETIPEGSSHRQPVTYPSLPDALAGALALGEGAFVSRKGEHFYVNATDADMASPYHGLKVADAGDRDSVALRQDGQWYVPHDGWWVASGQS